LDGGVVELFFDSNTLTPVTNINIGMISFTADSPFYTNPYEPTLDCNLYYPGCGDLNYLYEKENLLNNFFNTNMELSGYSSILYDISSFSALNDGLTPETPLLPNPNPNTNAVFDFTFDSNPTGFTFIDPEVATGYDYQITAGSNFFTDVLLPTGYGDNLFELWLFDAGLGAFVDTATLQGGIAYNFGSGGVDLFRITGIETSVGLDPNDPNAFVTGLQFINPGAPVSMSQTAITTFVPEPTTLLLFLSGMTLLMRQRKA
jgi:hypothetical protein